MAAPVRAPPPDPIVLARTLVYSITGILCAAGWILSAAFKDPCAGKKAVEGIATCHATFAEHLPGPEVYVALGIIWIAMAAMFELRWWIRVWLVAAIGAAEVFVGGLILAEGMSKVLGIVNMIIGVAMLAAAFGVHKRRRGAWAFAVVACGVLSVTYFFGSAKLRSTTGMHLSWAVLPALAVFLPACVALATSGPESKRYEPFAKRPTSPR